MAPTVIASFEMALKDTVWFTRTDTAATTQFVFIQAMTRGCRGQRRNQRWPLAIANMASKEIFFECISYYGSQRRVGPQSGDEEEGRTVESYRAEVLALHLPFSRRGARSGGDRTARGHADAVRSAPPQYFRRHTNAERTASPRTNGL